ncbi:MAG: CSLREA domain-containing protein [Proteobacteria bacterium]|nr:CSLREA domain-containing protein [Pseudomonadota bacterium]
MKVSRFPLLLLLALACSFSQSARAAIFEVTKTADTSDGSCDVADCSLREAILAANAGGSTVQIPAGVYRLTIPRAPRGDNAAGDGTNGNLVVNNAITVVGAGRDATIIDARPSAEGVGIDRVFSITQAGNLTISGVTITGGRTSGFGQGGGILSLGGSVSITDSAVIHNTGIFGGGGIAIASASNPAGLLTITRCEIAENTGGLAVGGGQGGGILNIQSSVSIFDSTIRDNAALNTTGGGIMNIDNQSRPSPPAALSVIRSTIVGNVAGDPARTSLNEGVGGGIYNNGGRLVLTNSTVAGNEAIPSFAEGFGFIAGTGRGGGVAHRLLLGDDPNDGTSIVNSTIAYNVAFTGSQLYGSDTVAPMRVANTVVVRDEGTAGNCASPSAEVGIDSFGGNISSDASPCFFDDPRDQTNLTPGLDTLLADNGGPTETLAPLDGSPAIGHARPESCPALDQRGVTRKEACDVGAYETVPEASATALGLAAMAGLVALHRLRTQS